MMAIDIDYQEDSLVDFDCKLDVIDKLEIKISKILLIRALD